ncbi:MAG: magnesium and cobalt transport protein CorA [Sphingomonadales bacterium]|nr:magnesium and cobalt transport protein CorA [Sphingomonadales bacterium]
MTIIAARRYAAGKPSEHAVRVDGVARPPLPAGSFDWIGLAEPDADEMALVASQFGLHPLAVEDALNPQQMPKVDIYGAQLFIAARTAAVEEGDNIGYGQTALFLGADFLVTVRFGSVRDHATLRRRLEADPLRLAEGIDYVAHAILDFIVDGYQPILDRMEDSVQQIEEAAIEAFPQPSTIRRIFRLRRRLRRFERIIGPMEEVCERLSTVDLPVVDPAARVWFRDVLDHVRRTMIRLGGLKETLASVVETASLLEQHRQGDMTRQLAAWAAILAVPTAIAGVYGMNFEFMPELHWRFGYFAVVGAMAAICGGLYWRFRRIGWL